MTRLAASQYAIELIETWEAYAAHLSAIVREAKEKGAELLLLPEYSAMALTGQLPPDARSDLHRSIEEIQPLIPSWVELCEELARQHQILFQPGSAPVGLMLAATHGHDAALLNWALALESILQRSL